MKRPKERIVWSSSNYGCLMTQHWHFTEKKWFDWTSSNEGEYPKYDATARAAVKMANAHRRASYLDERARQLIEQAGKLQRQAHALRFPVAKKPRAQGMSTYERQCVSFD